MPKLKPKPTCGTFQVPGTPSLCPPASEDQRPVEALGSVLRGEGSKVPPGPRTRNCPPVGHDRLLTSEATAQAHENAPSRLWVETTVWHPER